MESLPPENISDRLLELGRDLAEDVDRLRLELVELAQLVVGMGRVVHSWCWGTSRRDSSPHRSHRPASSDEPRHQVSAVSACRVRP